MRFNGRGNCEVERQRRGWEIICRVCSTTCRLVASGKGGRAVPPEEIKRRFSRMGWQIGEASSDDVCKDCRGPELRAQQEHDRNSSRAEHLLVKIQRLDKFLTDNGTMSDTIEFQNLQIELIKATTSLIESLDLFGVVVEHYRGKPKPPPPRPTLISVWEQASSDERREWWRNVLPPTIKAAVLAAIHGEQPTTAAEPQPEPPPPPPPPAPKPPTPFASAKMLALRDQLRQQLNGGKAS